MDENDQPLHDVDAFYAEYNADLIKVQNDLNRFTAPSESNTHKKLPIVFAAITIAVGVICLLIFLRRKKQQNDPE